MSKYSLFPNLAAKCKQYECYHDLDAKSLTDLFSVYLCLNNNEMSQILK